MFSNLLQQFMSFWKKLSVGRQITIVSLVAAAAILIPVLVSWATTPSYEVAYTGLSETDAAQIVQKLSDNNIAYQLKNTGTIMVPSDKVYTTRLLMASAGLPQSSTVGYELFSGTSTLGMTEFTQKVNYQRAIEGELERTIGSLDAVKTVRVHLVIPEKTLLASDQNLATASVTVAIKPGSSLSATQVAAITHLVASSVEGLKPENIVVVDSAGNMLADGTGKTASATTPKDDQRTAELAYSTEVQKRVQTLLDKILGPGHSTVQATVEMDWTQKDVTSNIYQPTQVAIRSSQKINETSNSAGSTGGVPGATSNLPTPVATTVGTGAAAYTRAEETLNYEISQIQAHEITAPGKVSRLSVSVMVDNITDKTMLATIKSAVEVAAGIDSTRGDQLAVESYAFDTTAASALTAEMAAEQQQQLYLQIGMAVAIALAVILVLVLVMRMLANMRKASRESWKTILRPVSSMTAMQDAQAGTGSLPFPSSYPSFPPNAMPASLSAPSDGSGPQMQQTPQQQMSQQQMQMPTQLPSQQENGGVILQLSSKPQNATAAEDEQRARIISRLTEENPATVAEIIQIWLNEGKK